MRIPTIKILNSNGGCTIINKSDFDPDVHQAWIGLQTEPEPVVESVVEPEDDDLELEKETEPEDLGPLPQPSPTVGRPTELKSEFNFNTE